MPGITDNRSMFRRIIDIPCIPLLILLHLIFTSSSLILRAYELLTSTEYDDEPSLPASSPAGLSPTATAFASRIPIPQTFTPPGHVGMVIIPPPANSFGKGPGRRGRGSRAGRAVKAENVRRVEESVVNLVEMALEEGVEELSVFEGTGLLELAREGILFELAHGPVSEDGEGEGEESQTPEASPTRRTPGRGGPGGGGGDGMMMGGKEWPSPDRSGVGAGIEVSPTRRRGRAQSLSSSRMSEATLTNSSDDGVLTLTVHPAARFHAPSSHLSRPLTIHLLPPSASEVVPRITRDLIAEGVVAEKVTQDVISRRVHDALHFTRDPNLLIVHHIQSTSGWRRWLPRPAPELGGYPYWTLRITEIYHHPPPLPFISALSPILHLARTSSLPFVRKLGRLVPPPASIRSELVDLHRGAGRLGMDEWDGAMRAWGAVEQRLGR